MSLNKQQKKIVETLDGSINVMAGAGTGKTFTLTQRIVASVKRRIEEGSGDDDFAGHVLAITFTNKAASELKARVRAAFLSEYAKGGDEKEAYLKCALSIDDAWICTIHSMAGRILRENALDFGIDPDFVHITDKVENVMLHRAIEESFAAAQESDDVELVEFLSSHDLLPKGQYGSSLIDHVSSLLSTVSYMPYSIDGAKVIEGRTDILSIASEFLSSAKRMKEVLGYCDLKGAQAKKASTYLEDMETALCELEEWIGSACSDFVGSENRLSEDADSAIGASASDKAKELVSVLCDFPSMTDQFGAKSDFAEDFARYKLGLKHALDRAISCVTISKDRSFLKFAQMVSKTLNDIKAKGSTKMSQSDILFECNRLLGLKENSHIAERYRNKFDLIMLDEFQDTDKLQMSLISKLAKMSDDGPIPIMRNLCTVGDMQQSIYRFRGGDVEQSQIRAESLKDGRGLQLELSNNYRSHSDVLDVVEAIFSQDEVFGEEFLRLNCACTSLDERCSEIFEKKARIYFDIIHSGSQKEGGGSIKDAREKAAENIASHFAWLKEKGQRPADMALLLGAMSNAEIYASAIRKAGLECAITAGSNFSKMKEPKLVSWLLDYAADQKDEVVLFQILTSELFAIDDDDLLDLCRPKIDGKVRRKGLSQAFVELKDREDLKGKDSSCSMDGDELAVAKEILLDFVEEARGASVSDALRRFFARSGLFIQHERKGDAQSLVSSGTIKKAMNIVTDLEKSAVGVAEVALDFKEYVSKSKETPGTLVTSSSDFIQIMTVHSSKGLEFKHVAVAELRDGVTSSFPPPFKMENVDDATYLAFKAEACDYSSAEEKKFHDRISAYKSIKEYESEDQEFEQEGLTKFERAIFKKRRIKDAKTHEDLLEALKDYDAMQNLDEARRLAYVALTRARESLYVSICAKGGVKGEYQGVFGDVVAAMEKHFNVGEDGLPETFSFVEMPISLSRSVLCEDGEAGEKVGDEEPYAAEADPDDAIIVPIYRDSEKLERAQSEISPLTKQMYSYTQLSESRPDLGITEDRASSLSDGSPYSGGIYYDTAVDDEMSMMAEALFRSSVNKDEDPLRMGEAFHRLAQAAIIEASMKDSKVLEMPELSRIDGVARACAISESQKMRLERAIRLWTESKEAKSFAEHRSLFAEIPFNVELGERNDGLSDEDSFVLYGEIDGLACDSFEHAYLIDYKTGNLEEESLDHLRWKYELQAKCYACALLMSDFKNVEAAFVLVERPVREEGSCDEEPMCIRYYFSLDDLCDLKSEIISLHRTYIEEKDL